MPTDRYNPELDAVFGVVTEFRPGTQRVSVKPTAQVEPTERVKRRGKLPRSGPSAPVVEAGGKMGRDQVRRLAFRVLSVLSDLNEAQRKRVLQKALRLSGG